MRSLNPHWRSLPFTSTLYVPSFATLILVYLGSIAQAQLEPRSLAEEVRKGIEDGSIATLPPRLEYDERRKELNFEPGGRQFSRERRTPLQYPTDLQVQIELIRKCRADEIAFWQPTLQKMEALVKADLNLVADFRGTHDQLLENLGENDDKARHVYMDAVITLAKNRGMTVQGVQGAGVWNISLDLQPPVARVYYLNRFDYLMAQKAGKEKSITAWNQASDTKIGLANGNYYFYALWPNGKSTMSSPVSITSDKTVKLSPDN